MRALLAASLVLLAAAPFASAQATENPSGPYGIHVGVTSDGADLVVQWFATASRDPSVAVADEAGAEVGTFAGAAMPFPNGASFVVSALLAGLAAGNYTYVATDNGVATAALPLRVPAKQGPVRLGFLGDQGVSEEAAANVATLLEADVAAVFHAGDLSYGEGSALTWDLWFAQNQPVAATVPWLPALGNHETYWFPTLAYAPFFLAGTAPPVFAPTPDPNPEVEAFKARFALPGNELWWSWDVGNVHVIALDTYESGIDAQLAWLAEDLAASASADWTIVFLHEPPFSSNAAHGSSVDLRGALAPVLEAAGVDLVVTAHDHHYERTWPLLGETPRNTTTPYVADAGVVYLVSGGGGRSLYEEFEEPAPAWSAFRAAEYHVVVVEATSGALRVQALKTDGSVLDEFSIERPRVPAASPDGEPSRDASGLAALAGVLALVAVARMRRR